MTTQRFEDLLPELALRINRYQCAEASLLLDEGKLRGACARPFATFQGAHLHAAFSVRAASLLDGICQAYAFADGNKLTPWLLLLTFIEMSGYET